jgi:RNA-directed DNA polymerase
LLSAISALLLYLLESWKLCGACLRKLPAKTALKRTDNEIKALFFTLRSARDVASLLEITTQKLAYFAYRKRIYKTFEIPKRRGGTRTIAAPNNGLKILQMKLNHVLRLIYEPGQVVHGFTLNRSIVTNAQSHTKRRFVLNIDLKDFFGSIHFGRVRGMLMARPYYVGPAAATFIAQLCTLDGILPQGAPTSPIITNMICGRLDSNLKALAAKYRCRYTRYADDITISASLRSFPEALARIENSEGVRKIILGDDLLSVINGNGFAINNDKVRLLLPVERQEVTGLVTNRFPNVPRSYIRQLYGLLHAWRKYGGDATANEFFKSHDSKRRSGNAHLLTKVVWGRIDFVGRVRGKDDPIYRKLLIAFANLNPSYEIKVPDDIDTDFKVIRKALWVAESDSTQGTAFLLNGYGMATCAHILGEGNLLIYSPQDPTKRYPVKSWLKDDERDVAFLEVDGIPKLKELRIGDSTQLKLHDPITLLGFPEHSKGDHGIVTRGEVTAERRIRSGQNRILISSSIVAGNSGGPVLNSRNQVIGIAATGADKFESTTATSNYGVIPIETLIDFYKEIH